MKSISFDNPYWLLIAIPLLAAVLIPYFISVSKDNKTKGWLASLVIHIVIVVSIALAAAGLVHTTVMTRTKVYVVADVSYSASRNFDKIDEYIQQIDDSLPSNSRLGIVCFGNDSTILTSSGMAIKSVREAKVDDSGTNIAGALDYTATLFSSNEIKRIVLITDGHDTTYDGSVVAAVERLAAKGIKLDAVYVDSNLKEGEEEVQISGVDFTASTYLNHESNLSMLVESSVPSDVILDLYVKGADSDEYSKINTTVLKADKGVNIATFPLPTDVSGVFDYKVAISASQDTSTHNNTYNFTQEVAGKRSVLLISGSDNDIITLKMIYQDTADVDFYHITGKKRDVPYSIEELSKYDEIILSNVDIREINNINAFIDSVDIAVSQYGKSLITLGDLHMQSMDATNENDKVFERLEELLPVSFGNANKDAKLYTIILDISRSMNDTSQLIIAKNAATKLLSILNDDDWVAYITLAGSSKVELTPTRLGDCRTDLIELINSAEPCQGTFIGESLKMAYSHMKDLDFAEKQVMLISDGLTFTYEPEDAVQVAKDMYNDGITVSTVNVLSGREPAAVNLLTNVANAAGGNYYLIEREEDVAKLIFADIAEDLIDTVVEKSTAVNVELFRDDVMEGIRSLPNVLGYVNSKPKLDATMVLSVDYQKNETTTVRVPLYSYRDHGNGRVATFTSSLSSNWLRAWSDSVKSKFFGNILSSNTPSERINYPYTINFEYGGEYSTIEMLPSYLNPRAKASIKITSPDGKIYEEQLAFDLNRYFTRFKTPDVGRYHIEIIYTYGNHSFSSNTYFNVSYNPEYNSFVAYDLGSIYDFMRGIGGVYTDGKVDLENDKTEVDTYERSFRLPLLVFAVALFVFDVFIRKYKPKRKQDKIKDKRKEQKNEST